MPEPISSNTSPLNYTPVDGEEGFSEPPAALSENSAAADPDTSYLFAEGDETWHHQYGDGEIHQEGFGFRVDPSEAHTKKFADGMLTVTASGVDALVAATKNNADGSQGARLAASANIGQATVSLSDQSGTEVTGGLGFGVGFDASSGTRDIDGDGDNELCVRASWNVVVAGICVE
jgi:hypothetical protein